MHTCTQVCKPSGGDDEDLKMYVTETIPMVVFSFFSSPLSFTLIKMPVSQPPSFPPTSFYLSPLQLSLPISPSSLLVSSLCSSLSPLSLFFPPFRSPSSFSLPFLSFSLSLSLL